MLLVSLLGLWGSLYLKSKGRYEAYNGLVMEGIRLQKIAPPMLFLLEKLKLSQRVPFFLFKIQRTVQKLAGDRRGGDLARLFLAEMLSYSWLLMTLGSLMTLLMGGDGSGLLLGGILAVLLPAALINDLHRKVVRREREVLLELPEFLNQLILLVGAGSTVQQAIKHCLERRKEEQSHPLYRELLQMQREWESGDSFQHAMEGFSKRCGIQEVSVFTTAVLLNFRRGGNDFVLALRDLSHSLWEKRKAVSKTLGEQASSKLVFPMVLLFVVVIILVGAPAFMIMDL
ncbi:type II secretion system F family protein [Paenibacillus faecis]|uniref:Type II secretion system F family protein n=1 Tax=Paenibacillus faecis TaxID=862114 RepID=A0A5D0D323_9BACL|nr:type II secretion system F family protein [Paenibacillus faecis]